MRITLRQDVVVNHNSKHDKSVIISGGNCSHEMIYARNRSAENAGCCVEAASIVGDYVTEA